MERNKAEMERSMNEEVTEEEEGREGIGEDNKRRRELTLSRRKVSGGGGAGSTQQYCCQVDNCGADMSNAKTYHRRHKVCEHHAKAPIVLVAGIQQRFCQQCSRFHELSEFDEAKRSCRRRLAGHNERRRKSSYESHGEGSS